jgi:hypothetical protein
MENYEKENPEKRALIQSKINELNSLCDGERYHLAVLLGEIMYEDETKDQSHISITASVNASSHTVITMLSDLINTNPKIEKVHVEICKQVLLNSL